MLSLNALFLFINLLYADYINSLSDNGVAADFIVLSVDSNLSSLVANAVRETQSFYFGKQKKVYCVLFLM